MLQPLSIEIALQPASTVIRQIKSEKSPFYSEPLNKKGTKL